MRFAAAETAMPHFSEARVTLPHSMAARKIRRVVQSGRFIGLYSATRSFVQGPPREAGLIWREHTNTSLRSPVGQQPPTPTRYGRSALVPAAVVGPRFAVFGQE